MFYNRPINKIHIEPTTKCNARCPQCLRTFGASLRAVPELIETDVDPEKFELLLKQDFFKSVEMFHVNGNLGDIVMHPYPYEFVMSMRKAIPLAMIKINTNGGGLSKQFWKWFGAMENTEVEFGIDGLADTHSLYRRNTRWDTVIENAGSYIDAGGVATWTMLVFQHNEHQVDECRRMAAEMGFNRFEAKPSVRWHNKDRVVVDRDFNEVYRLSPSSEVAEKFKDLDIDNSNASSYHDYLNREKETHQSKRYPSCIECKVQKERSVYISSDLRLWPCCWIKNHVDQNEWYGYSSSFVEHFYESLGYETDFNDLSKYSVDDIMATGLFEDIAQSWNEDSFYECIKTCGNDNSITYRENKTKIWKRDEV